MDYLEEGSDECTCEDFDVDILTGIATCADCGTRWFMSKREFEKWKAWKGGGEREMTTTTQTKPRWRAVAYYRTDAGVIDVEHFFEELVELDDLMEKGPSWEALVKVEVFYGRDEGKTIEQCLAE